jgi:Transposase DDE domain/Domain of unknown function (DUF4372)
LKDSLVESTAVRLRTCGLVAWLGFNWVLRRPRLNEARRAQAMHYQATIFAQLLKVLPRARFERIAARHRQGRAKRRLSDWGHLVTMVYAHLSGARSLRELERVLERHPGALAHLGLSSIRRSTLADANEKRPAALFEDIAATLAGEMGSRSRALRLIDATRIFAGKRIEHWALGGAVKLHIVFDPKGGRPVCFAVTPERATDLSAARGMPIEPNATYVFDRGYYDFSFWARLDAAGCTFVTRLKSNSPTRLIEQRPLATDGAILAECIVNLSQRLCSSRSNPYAKPVRLILVRIDNGRVLTLITNDMQSTPEQIAALYKARWQIELFFKWIKQNLKLIRFLGTSRNAVTIQILAALIAYLILRLCHSRHAFSLSLSACANLVTAAILQRRTLNGLLNTPPPPSLQTQPLQMAFAL